MAKSDCGSTVPRKIALNWFIPAFVKRRVGSEKGTTGDEGTVLKSANDYFQEEEEPNPPN